MELFLLGSSLQVCCSVQCIVCCAVCSTPCGVRYTIQCAVRKIVCSTPYSVQYNVQHSDLLYRVIFNWSPLIYLSKICQSVQYTVLLTIRCTGHYTPYCTLYFIQYTTHCTLLCLQKKTKGVYCSVLCDVQFAVCHVFCISPYSVNHAIQCTVQCQKCRNNSIFFIFFLIVLF